MSQLPTPTSFHNNTRQTICGSTSTDPGPTCRSQTKADISEQPAETGRFPLYNRGNLVGYSNKLVEVPSRGNHKMIEEVAPYVLAMINAAAQEGVTLRVTSGFRTMSDQQRLWGDYQAGRGNLAARPGTSKHQAGIAVDFDYAAKQSNAPDYNTAYDWLVRNAYLFGFVRTVHIERWHWEYWGDWTGQQQPSWSEGWHAPKSMFSFVPRVHQCGRDSKTPMRDHNWWGTRFNPPQGSEHLDNATLGATNSWIGWDGQHTANYWDRADPGWDRRSVFTPTSKGNATAAQSG